ncbi:LOW QUALITY PROTEIN: carboxylesterase 4A, partial [Trichechus inunguis]
RKGGARRKPCSPPPPQGPDSRRAVRYLQESWGQITSVYFNTQKQKWLRLSEDYLNVYAPLRARGDAPLPMSTSSSILRHPAQASALPIQMIGLVPGRRLLCGLRIHVQRLVAVGVLGFLSTGDNQARGNWALLDQLAALFWVQEKNIEVFGGDWDCMTLFGQSAGSMCISGLMVSPLAQGLFYQAISQNSIMVFRVFITPGPLRVAKGFLHLNFQQDPREAVRFLSPVVDGMVFPNNPVVLLAWGQIVPVPYLLGINSLEFNLLPYVLVLWADHEDPTKPVRKEKRHHHQTALEYQHPVAGDTTFVYPTLLATHYHRDAGLPVYLYEFEYHSAGGIIIKPHTDGADHGDEIHFLFGSSFSKGIQQSFTSAVFVPSPVLELGFKDGADMKPICLTIISVKPSWTPSLNGKVNEGRGREGGRVKRSMNNLLSFLLSRNPNCGNLSYWPSCEKDEKYLQLDVTMSVGVKLKEKMDFWMRLHQH